MIESGHYYLTVLNTYPMIIKIRNIDPNGYLLDVHSQIIYHSLPIVANESGYSFNSNSDFARSLIHLGSSKVTIEQCMMDYPELFI